MSEAVRFLHALAQALATLGLYAPGHPAATRALDQLWQMLRALMAKTDRVTFFFLGGAPVYDGRALHELAGWPWGQRLADTGVQRLEFEANVDNEALSRFLTMIQARFAAGATTDQLPSDEEYNGIRFGAVEVMDQFEQAEAEPEPEEDGESRELALNLTDELEATAYILGEARRGMVALAEANAVIRILASQLERYELPQAAPPPDHATYPQVHAVNTALLMMAVAGNAGIDPAGRHRLGIAALLHDVGMATLPEEFALLPSFSEAQRRRMEEHPRIGAQMLLERGGRGSDLAAAVAFEHHLRPDGTGYPNRRFGAPTHWASRIIGAAAAYVSLRAPRPFRAAWAPLRAVGYLEEGAGSVFDAEAARAVASLVRVAPEG
jgi:HD-GYP domain-containing protein (c-di-GMP phosphodiesterase class II)